MTMIVVEGLDGSGKTTLVKNLVALFEANGQSVLALREPGSTKLAEGIRTLLKDPEYKDSMTDISELLLFYAARRSLLEHTTVPALREGKVVIYDRFNVSTVAYQGIGSGLLQEVQHLTKMVLGDFQPDLYVFVDVDDEVAHARRVNATELDRIEQKGPEYRKRVKSGFDIALRDCGVPYIVVDGNLSERELAHVTFHEIQHRIQGMKDGQNFNQTTFT